MRKDSEPNYVEYDYERRAREFTEEVRKSVLQELKDRKYFAVALNLSEQLAEPFFVGFISETGETKTIDIHQELDRASAAKGQTSVRVLIDGRSLSILNNLPLSQQEIEINAAASKVGEQAIEYGGSTEDRFLGVEDYSEEYYKYSEGFIFSKIPEE